MAVKSYNMGIDGYWREPNINGIPSKYGVYFVYVCSHNSAKKSVILKQLIYIGESENVNERIKNHEKWDEWRKSLSYEDQLCFSFGEIPSSDRNRVEAAYIFKHKPPVNTEYVNSFPFDQTSIESTGKTTLLNINFTVYRT